MAATLPALAQPQADTLPAAPESRQSSPGEQDQPPRSQQVATGFWDRANLFGNWGGVRTRLADRGVSFTLSETSEVFGNPSGGTRRGVVYEGLTQFGLQIDSEKLLGLAGGTFNVTGFQIHGRGLSLNNLANNLHTVSGIEAQRGTLLFELWYEQMLFGDALAIRVGQLAADQEFMVSQYAGLFINHTFGWSSLPSVDLPSGGPSYPLATPGVRLKWTPREDATVLLGVFNGDPAGTGPGGAQDRNPSGTAFRLRDGVFAIAELQYALNRDGSSGLPGVYKLGAWYNSQPFMDQRRDANGVSLADPASLGVGRGRRNNWSVYGVMDQLLVRRAGTQDQGLGVFARLMGAPGDRNLLNFYVDAGVTYKGALPGRVNDTVGLGFGLARYSDTAAQFDSDAGRFSGEAYPIRRHESVLELTYQAQLAPWWQLQPTAQYIFNLGGGVLDPQRPGKRLGDSTVLGLRTTITF